MKTERPAQCTSLLLVSLALLAGCGAGRYGHAPNYVPLGEEEKAASGARSYDPVDHARMPEAWGGVSTSVFGIVRTRGEAPEGHTHLTLDARRLEDRNLCANREDPRSCRVTVSVVSLGEVSVIAKLEVDDELGERAVGPGSLVRVVGSFGRDFDAVGGTPILRATYVRHWPRGSFVTRAAATTMRQ